MKKKNFIGFIKERTRCLDGGTGSMLFSLGHKDGCPEMADEEIIKQIHLNYLNAGSDIILTNTFGGTKLKLQKYGLGDKVAEINERNARIASSIKFNREFYVGGDIGPTGEFMEPFGDYTYEQFTEAFSEQAAALEKGGADVIFIETMMSIDEYKAAIEAAKKATKLPVMASMSFNKNPNGFFSMGGDTLEKMAAAAKETGADSIGANCNLNPADMAELAEKLVKIADVPVFIEPNAGDPIFANGKTIYEPIENLEKHLLRIFKAGVAVIGGCCGTDEEYIRILRKIVYQEK